jgi:lipoate-protein ligase A
VVSVRRSVGSAGEFHHRPIVTADAVELWSFTVDRPTIVLGSHQDRDTLDVAACASHGVDVARRRSGGGIVLLEPGAIHWIDVVVTPRSPWWTDDVVSALVRCGHAWLDALSSLRVAGAARVHEGRLVRDRVSDLVCFAGLGAGEVVDAAGAKLLGLSQRRTRDGARLQGAIHRRWNPGLVHDLLSPGLVTAAELAAISVATVDVDGDDLLSALAASVAAAAA